MELYSTRLPFCCWTQKLYKIWKLKLIIASLKSPILLSSPLSWTFALFVVCLVIRIWFDNAIFRLEYIRDLITLWFDWVTYFWDLLKDWFSSIPFFFLFPFYDLNVIYLRAQARVGNPLMAADDFFAIRFITFKIKDSIFFFFFCFFFPNLSPPPSLTPCRCLTAAAMTQATIKA